MVTATLAVALAVSTLSVSTTAGADDDLKDKQKQVEKELDTAHDDLHASSKSLQKATARLDAAKTALASAQAALMTAETQVEVAAAQDAEMQAALATAEADLAQAEADLASGQEQREVQRQSVADTVLNIYMQGDPELLAFASLMDAETTDDLSRREQLRDVVVDNETRTYDDLKAAEVLLKVREEQVTDARDAVAVQRQAAAEHLVLMEQLAAEKEAASVAVAATVSEADGAKIEARVAKQKDAAKIRQLEAQQTKIEKMLAERARRALAKARAQNAAGAVDAPSNGVLQHPVSGGYVTSPFGFREHPIYHYWGLHDGTDFGGGCGTPLVASADGRVVDSFWSSVYGNRMIIDFGVHSGSSLAGIYNHATNYTVSPGDRVQRGQVVGYMGSTGWSTGCHLHYTVMANGSTVDPMKWF